MNIKEQLAIINYIALKRDNSGNSEAFWQGLFNLIEGMVEETKITISSPVYQTPLEEELKETGYEKEHTANRTVCPICKIPFCPECWPKCPFCFPDKKLDEITKPTNDKFKFLKSFKLTVPKDYDHDTQLKSFAKKHQKDFYFYNDDITDKNFAKAGNKLVPGKTYEVKVWGIEDGKVVSSNEVYQLLKENKVILTGAQGNSLVYQEKKEELPIGKWTISFDEKDNLWQDADGGHRVPGIKHGSVGYYEFILVYFECDLLDDCCLVGFCDCIA